MTRAASELAALVVAESAAIARFTPGAEPRRRDAGVQLRQIEARQQSPDHPILWGVDETNYLKFYLFQVF